MKLSRPLALALVSILVSGPAAADPQSLAQALASAVDAADPATPASRVLSSAGIEQGSLTREQVFAAFRGSVGEEELAALADKLDSQYGPRRPLSQATVAELGFAAKAGEQHACLGCVIASAAMLVVAAVALSGCGTPGDLYKGTAFSDAECWDKVRRSGAAGFKRVGVACYGMAPAF